VVEQEGINRAHRAIESADHVLVIVDVERMQFPQVELPGSFNATLVLNKIDLVEHDSDGENVLSDDAKLNLLKALRSKSALPTNTSSAIRVSAKTGQGMDALKQHLLLLAGHDAHMDDAFIARRRHLDALDKAKMACMEAIARLEAGVMPELAAEELRQAQLALDAVTGRFDSEDLLGEIFGSFCIGK